MQAVDQTKSSESVLLNPEDETLNDAESFPYQKVLKESNKRIRGKNIEFKLPEFFDNFKEMESKVQNGEINGNFWELKSKQDGISRYYCRFMEHGCRAAMVLELVDENRCKFKESEETHSNHPEQHSPKKKVDLEVMSRIKELHVLGIKPQGIISRLFKEGLEAPSISKIYNITKELRKQKTVSTRPTLRQIVEWCEKYNQVPEDENEVFVGFFEYESIDTQQIRVFLTTKQLLKYALKTDYILSDATYKLTFAGFPVLTGGNTDRAKSFHPYGIALCSCQTTNDFSFFFRSVQLSVEKVYNQKINPKTLVADCDDAITNGFKQVFSLEKRVTCWAHVRRNIDDDLKIFDEQIKEDIFNDIYSIQELFRDDLFTIACELFEKKWKGKDSNVDKFLSDFKKNSVNKNNGWSEGFCNGLPSTTNALESTHAKIKDFVKTRLGLIEFLNECRENLVRFWSQIRSERIIAVNRKTNKIVIIENNNLKEFNDEPIIDNSDLLFAYKWNKKSKPFQHINDVYMVKSGKKSDFTRDEGKRYLSDLESKTWTTFNEMISSLNSIRIVKVNRENWKLSSCTCSYWLKNYYCCHSIACCYRLSK